MIWMKVFGFLRESLSHSLILDIMGERSSMHRERNVGKMQKLKVTSNEAGQRLDKLLAKYLARRERLSL